MSREWDNNTSNYLDAGAISPNITGTEITVAMWVRPDFVNSERGIITKWAGTAGSQQFALEFSFTGDSALEFFTTDSGGGGAISVNGTTAVSTGQWSHVCGRQTSGQMNVYLNGAVDGTRADSRSLANSGGRLQFGRYEAAGLPMDGLGAEAGLWDEALSTMEIASLAMGMPPYLIRNGALRGYWPIFGTGSPEPDLSGTGIGATLNGTLAIARNPPVRAYTMG